MALVGFTCLGMGRRVVSRLLMIIWSTLHHGQLRQVCWYWVSLAQTHGHSSFFHGHVFSSWYHFV
jgi:hypothetical protein